jgi:thiosulfate/3-mercaptopyruvate sulfurtransferase
MIKSFTETNPKGEKLLNWKKTAVPLLLSFSLVLAFSGSLLAAPAKPALRKPEPVAPVSAAKLPGGSEGREAFFVTLDWVKDNARGVVLLDARPASLYNGGHIPGAVNAEWQSFSSMKGLPGSRGWATLLAPKSLAARIGALGIDGSRPVIVYGEPGSWGQEGFVALTLRMAGVPGVRVLDGGWPAWRAAGLPVTKEYPKVRPANFQIKVFRDELRATVEHIRERMGTAKLLDVRTLEEYRGARYFSEKRGGHIPGAILVPYNQLVGRDGILLPETDLRALFEKAGIRPEDEIIAYDTAGVRSAYTTWVLLMLGYPKVRVYDASFHEWAGIPELSVETGDPGELPVLTASGHTGTQPVPAVVPPASSEAPAASEDTKPQIQQPAPVVVQPVSKDVQPSSGEAKPQVLKPIPIAVQPVQQAVSSPDATAVPSAAQGKPAPAAARIVALRWNREGKTVRAVIDVDKVAEPRVLVKPNLVELAFGAIPAASLTGLPSPYEKDVSVVLIESGTQSTLKFSHKAKGVKHFQLENPYRYVVDFQF